MHRWIVNRWIVYRELAQPVALRLKTRHLICRASQMAGFYDSNSI